MSPAAERRLLQAALAATLLLPFYAATMGVVRGAAWLDSAGVARDLDSHFRYLNGIHLMMLCMFASCIPGIERRGGRFRLLGALVIAGGVARLIGWASLGAPSPGFVAGLGIELIIVPLLLLWQARVALP